MSDETDIAQIVAIISAAYPNFKASEMTVEVYHQCLKDIPADMLKAATLQAIAEPGRAFAPSVGELRGAVLNIRKAASGVPTSFQAWGEVRQAMIEVGYYRSPEFSCEFIAQAVKIMGWRNLCVSENEVADRAHFAKIYDQLVERAEADANMLPEVKGYITDIQPGIKLLADKLSTNK